jgi:hypothetical protein
VSRHCGWKLSSNRIKCLRRVDLDEMTLEALPLRRIQANVAVLQALQTQIESLEQVLAD